MRRATHADVLRLVELGAAMHAESRFNRFALNLKRGESYFHAALDNPGTIFLVDGDPIHAMFIGFVQRFWWGDELESFDLLLFVLPEKRGKGYSAAKLISGYRQIAEAMGVSDIRIGVSTEVEAERTCKFFECMGFEPMARGFAITGNDKVRH